MLTSYIYCKDYYDNKHVLKEFLTPIASKLSELSSRDIFGNSEIKGQIIKYCLILKKYLINCKTNNICNNSKGCWYINYLINDKKRDIYDNLDNTIFDIYNGFIMDDNELKEIKKYEYNKIISDCLIRDNNDSFCESSDNLNSVFKEDEWISKNKSALVGIFLLLLYLYKFAPFGQWLSSRRGTIRISQHINNEMYELQEHSSENYQTNLEHIRCNVPYQSIGHT
ncbi:PIR Superfamily Protein [Plasmodium ovale wallikeri]|uniref:PIR Superfamily Protein n=1 Tax=Plasmodium ovale wallikeri TaxID=864142 RepID=A0A1A9AMD5_PLAOA|nr:PIR Superfamily Protein [Plasmodium ovale wallikeri]SBT57376.1 PIR Superfamily Protein [Plasmodium ovale wallikeri]